MAKQNYNNDDDYKEEYIGSVHSEFMRKILSDGSFTPKDENKPKKSKSIFQRKK